MATFLYIVFFVSCIVLVIAVLLQPGKTDAGALFTSGVSSAALNPRGTQSVLSKITIGAAVLFMLTALLLSLPAITGTNSVFDSSTGSSSTAPAGDDKKGEKKDDKNVVADDKKSESKDGGDSKAEEKKTESTDSKDEKKASSESKGDEKKPEAKKEADKSESSATKTEVKKSDDSDK